MKGAQGGPGTGVSGEQSSRIVENGTGLCRVFRGGSVQASRGPGAFPSGLPRYCQPQSAVKDGGVVVVLQRRYFECDERKRAGGRVVRCQYQRRSHAVAM